MSRVFVIALSVVIAIAIASVSVWYVVDDDDVTVATDTDTSGGANTAPKKVIKTLTGEAIATEEQAPEESEIASETIVANSTADETQPEAINSDESSESTAEGSTVEEAVETASIESEDATASPASNVTGSEITIDPALSFDVIRVEKSGDTVLAGRAPAGSDVRILDGTTILGTIESDNNGQWVYVLETPLQPGAHELGLQVNNEDGTKIKSKDVAIVDVPKGDKSALAVLVPDEEPGGTPSVSKVIQLPANSGEDGIRDVELALDSVDYDDDGQTVIGGTSQPGQKVVGYLNNEFVGQGVADNEGRWIVEPEKKVDEGLHQLRIDQVDDGGKVIARVEIPFSRSGKVETLPDERIVTVQPGNSLWRISRAIYGQGGRYAVIYERNQDQIRNPDLIYPGQIFVLPKAN
ncbi:LysM peptidoglycan-binding domain-containing protein [Kiloniella sp.]|uniref:LysM peptidoglycan-binding domain-containing protein n=1 Tax=Kiloniella sp. TaxID=1938587 RepID=UPI003B0192DF